MSDRFEELDELIRAGWGDMAQSEIPADWRTRTPPDPEPYIPTRQYITAKKVALMDPDAAATLCSELRKTIGRPRGARGRHKLTLEERARQLRDKLRRQSRYKRKITHTERSLEYMKETGRDYTVNVGEQTA